MQINTKNNIIRKDLTMIGCTLEEILKQLKGDKDKN